MDDYINTVYMDVIIYPYSKHDVVLAIRYKLKGPKPDCSVNNNTSYLFKGIEIQWSLNSNICSYEITVLVRNVKFEHIVYVWNVILNE